MNATLTKNTISFPVPSVDQTSYPFWYYVTLGKVIVTNIGSRTQKIAVIVHVMACHFCARSIGHNTVLQCTKNSFLCLLGQLRARISMVKRFIIRVKHAIAAMLEDDEDTMKPRMENIKAFIDSHYRRPANVYSVTKKLIKEATADKKYNQCALDTFRETPQERQQTEAKAQEALEKRNDKVTTFNLLYVLQSIYTLSSDLNDYPSLFVALQVACGCRQRDLFDPNLCQFTDAGQGCVLQQGSSKSRKPFKLKKKLVGMSVTRFLTLLQWFRAFLEPGSSLEMAKKTSLWNRKLCERTKQFFPIEQERSGTHVNRALYAALLRVMGDGKKSAPRSVQNSLGHTGMSSSLHYLYVDVKEEGGIAPMKDLLLKIPATVTFPVQ